MCATLVPGMQLAVAEVAEDSASADGGLSGGGSRKQTAVVEGTVMSMHSHPTDEDKVVMIVRG